MARSNLSAGWMAWAALAALLGALLLLAWPRSDLGPRRADPTPLGAPLDDRAPVRGGVLNVGMDNDARTLDPIYQLAFSERQPEYLIYNTLLGLTKDFELVPELAERWSLSADGLLLTLYLRKDVKFHDGTPFDAASVKWNMAQRLDPMGNSPSKSELGRIIASVDIVDRHTVRIRLKTPSPSLLGMLAQREGFMVSPAAARKFGDAYGQHPVGTGPFIFSEWQRNNRIVVRRNPNYWDRGKPYLDGVVFHLLANSSVGVARLQTGELDILSYLSPNQVRPLIGKPGIKLVSDQRARWVTLHLDNAVAPFDDVRVRRAIAYGLDRNKIVAIATAGKGVVANGPTPPGMWWFTEDLPAYPHDPDKARRLLAEAGYRDGVTLTLSTPPDALYRPVAALVQEQLAAVGIDVVVRPVSASMWGEMAMTGQISFLPIRWTQRPDPDGLLSALLEGKSSQNWVHYRNPEYDRLLEAGRRERDQERRRVIYAEAQRIIGNDLPYINLFFSVEYSAMRSNVRNFVFIPDGIPRFREIWKFDDAAALKRK